MLIIYYFYQKTTQYLILKGHTASKHQSQLSHPNNRVLLTSKTTSRIIKYEVKQNDYKGKPKKELKK